MKIALVNSDKLPCPPIRSGAVPLLIDQIATYLVRMGYSITVFSIQDPLLSNYEIKCGVEFIRCPQSRYIEEVLFHLENNFFNLIQVYNTPLWILPIKRVTPMSKITLSLHNLKLGHSVGDYESINIIEIVDHIITVSKFVAQDIISHYPASSNKITSLYTGEDPSHYISHFSDRGTGITKKMKGKLGIPLDYNVILFVGRLVSKKGCHHLIEAMRFVIKKNPKTALVIVGSKEIGTSIHTNYIHGLKERAKQISKHIHFTDFLPVNELPDYYTMSDVFVCPSQWQEPLARVHFEAMAAALPVVTTMRGGNPEVVINGKNGYVVEQYDNPKAFAKVICSLLRDESLRCRMGNINRKMIRKKMNFKSYAKNISHLYEKIINSK
ncbi:glycosyltransferase family 4 protein [Paenibacillus sedimenti]|nr:glycosyltransferase family 4 protein [Paenibacillus sedimenti]